MKIVSLFFQMCVSIFCNCLTTILNIFIWRDNKIWLFGAWFGERFADNSRYLFQYLDNKKNQFGIKKVVWVTRNKEVYDLLHSNGYNVYNMHSFMSFFYHLKSGVHVICNLDSNHQGKKADIMTLFSMWAKKINLWHGISVKATGYLQNKNFKNSFSKFYYFFICRFLSPGMWGFNYFLCTSKLFGDANIADRAIIKNRIIISNYPRLYPCPKIFKNEEKPLTFLQNCKDAKKTIILYTPTFRNNKKNVDPANDSEFVKFLTKKDIIWVTKKHKADVSDSTTVVSPNIYHLSSDFEINLVFKFVDIAITDYSSTSSDAMFFDIPTIEYCPDFDDYLKNDRGFIIPFELVHVSPPVFELDSLMRKIEQIVCDDKKPTNYEITKKRIFGDSYPKNLDQVFIDICKATHIKLKGFNYGK